MLYVYNTLSRQKEQFVPINPENIRMYVCGMTVYDHCHVGHARVLVVFDTVYRHLSALGYPVTYVRNITDIEDKIIQSRSMKTEKPLIPFNSSDFIQARCTKIARHALVRAAS